MTQQHAHRFVFTILLLSHLLISLTNEPPNPTDSSDTSTPSARSPITFSSTAGILMGQSMHRLILFVYTSILPSLFEGCFEPVSAQER